MTRPATPKAPTPHPARMYGARRVAAGIGALLFGPRDRRRRAVQELVRISVSWAGYYIGDDYKLWRKDRRFFEQFERLSPHNYYSQERKYALKELAGSLRHLDGAIAECGCYVGVSAWFLADVLPDVDFYLFDSFAGLSEPGVQDAVDSGLQAWQSGDLSAGEQVLRQNLEGFSNIHIKRGWIPDRFADVADRRFRLVHIDVDLYQPTIDSLRFFYPRMNGGGMIVMDDYGYENCPGAHRAAREFMADKPESIVHLPTGQGLIIRLPAVDS